MTKRLFDIIVSIAALIALLPLLLVVALSVRMRLGNPVFFRQLRPGLNGKPFEIIKFRTMTEARDSSGSLLPDEQRLPLTGKLLRATSLDELPELWNVLRGDMSLVGPRPLLMSYLPLYNAYQARRHLVRPGLTGWAQINGRNATTWEERFRLDVWYVENHSFLLDLRIMLVTCWKVFRREGISAEGQATMPAFQGNQELLGADSPVPIRQHSRELRCE